ncbi:glycosyl hydrolase [Paenibacillus hemerocallicola]|uniref:Glycosyl hydrolase n=1 Tax=Paenibacillus hemerocallicola TaxID=1172614 RepID=A0A5C4TDR8_9BACL|nr:glycoside hydrolase family 76 protein [Paenibacillus hemerocallicola]TNJ67234.1 glycosyl hydrolase [Paenibacillus hemerocallicola]
MKHSVQAQGLWGKRADEAQNALEQMFWNESLGMYDIEIPRSAESDQTVFHYWWMAHAVDVLVDGLLRTNNERYLVRLRSLYDGIVRRNGGALPNELYDDMEWMAIAWLRAYEATGQTLYKQAALVLWDDIVTGWNEQLGGGIAWRKSQTDYKNTPANAPAVILAARLYRAFGREDHLAWAHRIYAWQRINLVDPATGFVWDGMNRTGDGKIDQDWKFTYCQGVYIGAAVELYRITGERTYLADAIRTYDTAKRELADSATGMLPDEGRGDGGLFKGILVRYAAELEFAAPTGTVDAAWFLTANADRLWLSGKSPDAALFGTDWSAAPEGGVPLSAQLSAMKLLEQAARFETRGIASAT